MRKVAPCLHRRRSSLLLPVRTISFGIPPSIHLSLTTLHQPAVARKKRRVKKPVKTKEADIVSKEEEEEAKASQPTFHYQSLTHSSSSRAPTIHIKW